MVGGNLVNVWERAEVQSVASVSRPVHLCRRCRATTTRASHSAPVGDGHMRSPYQARSTMREPGELMTMPPPEATVEGCICGDKQGMVGLEDRWVGVAVDGHGLVRGGGRVQMSWTCTCHHACFGDRCMLPFRPAFPVNTSTHFPNSAGAPRATCIHHVFVNGARSNR